MRAGILATLALSAGSTPEEQGPILSNLAEYLEAEP
jgi:hypothetical protein